MSWGSAIVAIKTANSTLNTLVGTRFYRDAMPQNVTLPAVRFQKISHVDENAMTPVVANNRMRIQMDGYVQSARSGGAVARETLRTALLGAYYGYSGSIGGEVIKSILKAGEAEGIEMLNTSTEADHIRIDFMVDMA